MTCYLNLKIYLKFDANLHQIHSIYSGAYLLFQTQKILLLQPQNLLLQPQKILTDVPQKFSLWCNRKPGGKACFIAPAAKFSSDWNFVVISVISVTVVTRRR